MALINYVEPISIGEIFVGMASLILVCFICYMLWRIYRKIFQHIDISVSRSMKYEVLEEVFLNQIAKEKGIDLNKELAEHSVMKESFTKPNFRKKVEEEIYKKMFAVTKD